MDVLLVVLLVLAFVAGLLLVPFAFPGLWLMVAALLGYGAATGFQNVGLSTVGWAAALAAVGEALDLWLSFHYSQRYGGSRRAGLGAILGGIVGALVGVPLPLVGSLVGAFVGAFIGATLLEFTRAREAGTSAWAGWGAVLARVASAAVKVGLGIIIALLGLHRVFFT